jgi:hypothetical protein
VEVAAGTALVLDVVFAILFVFIFTARAYRKDPNAVLGNGIIIGLLLLNAYVIYGFTK